MAANTGKLVGRTVFITGASRGIGKAIAVKLGKNGANVIVAAKTAEPHPKLPGTIYTAAKEVEDAGGKALPCIVDIRNEEQVASAVKEAVKKFGGIDILVNNASAISLTGTLQTPMKRYDLMNGINARGTYLCSQACLPHLLKSQNAHILNISPPLNMAAKWFKGHVAYTMAKYGMSMCALGMSEEYRDEGVAVNTLWPRTAIYTAAMEMLGGGPEVAKQCRHPEIMADAAYAILTKDSRNFTGHFCIDDEILLQEGVKDIGAYDCSPGSNLLPDFFLDVSPEQLAQQMSAEGATPAFYKAAPSGGETSASSSASAAPEATEGPAATFNLLEGLLSEELVQRVKGVFQFDLTGSHTGTWFLDLKNGTGAVGKGEPATRADCTMKMDSSLFTDMFAGKASPTTSFMMGKLKIKGDMSLAMKLEKLMQQTQKSKL
ncbi:hydroxysteroid dehydrogenase-like protein 2 [Littorina saxatilis]|uniref:Hydroxysteroid dehydrogenase-like protein 2 n=1 Tax=Littorina saxatilis TaxID=31220 RepID=A0AAN9B8J1_9CAEN